MQCDATGNFLTKPLGTFLAAMWLFALSLTGAMPVAHAAMPPQVRIVSTAGGQDQLQRLEPVSFIGILPNRGVQAMRGNESNRKIGFAPTAGLAAAINGLSIASAYQYTTQIQAASAHRLTQAAHGCRAPPV